MICNAFSSTHPCVIIDVLADVWVEEVINELAGGFVINACGRRKWDDNGRRKNTTRDPGF